MKHSFLLTLTVILSPPCIWISRHIFVIEGFILPSERLQLSRRSLLAKHISSKKNIQSTISLNCADKDETISNGGDYRRPRGGRKSESAKREIKAGTFNLIKALAGTGILALPMGVAKSSDFKTSIIPAIVLMTILGGVSAYTFTLYGRLIHASQAKTLGELWEKKMDKNSGMDKSFFALAVVSFC